ncbi:hypothetical protein FQZ97_420580 [compost metagenome]
MAVNSGSAGVRFPPALRLSGSAATNDFPIVLLPRIRNQLLLPGHGSHRSGGVRGRGAGP